jgi:Ca2+-binding EF-hand superfamily protein
MNDISQIIRGIDKDRNGYITRNELDDILKEVYPELKTKDLMRIIAPFTSA